MASDLSTKTTGTRAPADQAAATLKPSAETAIKDWVVAAALEGHGQASIVRGVCERLIDAGVTLSRVNFSQPTLHPIVEGYLLIWDRATGAVIEDGWLRERDVPPGGIDTIPFGYLFSRDAPEIRERLWRDPGPSQFTIVNRFREEGATDYLAILHRLGERTGLGPTNRMISSWVTDRPGAFLTPRKL